MEFLLVMLPALSCAALMFICFRGMRHTDMGASSEERQDPPALRTQVDALQKEVTALRAQLDRERSEPSGADP